ncbi:MAG: DUF2093 domain-containing protein [Pseudomonadota bacterium]
MSEFERDFTGEAKLEYGDADFMILQPGSHVLCAVSGDQIPISRLRYWSAELQEAYRDAQAATKRWLEVHGGPGGAAQGANR